MAQLDEVSQSIGRLQGQIAEGFSKIDQHFATLNGKIADQERRLNVCESELDQQKGAGQRTHILWGAAVAVVGILISIFK